MPRRSMQFVGGSTVGYEYDCSKYLDTPVYASLPSDLAEAENTIDGVLSNASLPPR